MVTHRPDGFYWQDEEGVEYGPFATLLEAEQSMEAADGDAGEEPIARKGSRAAA